MHSMTLNPNPNVNYGWYGYYLPQWLWGNTYAYDNHWIRTCLSYSEITGIKENSQNTVKLSQNIPNPADNTTLINYELKGENNITLEVTDIMGRVVMNINQGTQESGAHSITLNTNSLSGGMYFYTLISNNDRLTLRK